MIRSSIIWGWVGDKCLILVISLSQFVFSSFYFITLQFSKYLFPSIKFCVLMQPEQNCEWIKDIDRPTKTYSTSVYSINTSTFSPMAVNPHTYSWQLASR